MVTVVETDSVFVNSEMFNFVYDESFKVNCYYVMRMLCGVNLQMWL